MEDGKNQAPMSELTARVKTYKKQIEEAEVIAALNLAKWRRRRGPACPSFTEDLFMD